MQPPCFSKHLRQRLTSWGSSEFRQRNDVRLPRQQLVINPLHALAATSANVPRDDFHEESTNNTNGHEYCLFAADLLILAF